MQAIVNNYLDDPTSDDAVEEMLEMQNWRKAAKVIAKDVLEFEAKASAVQNYAPGESDASASDD